MKTLTLILTLLMALNANAETTVGGYAACVSEITYDEYLTASMNGDDAALKHLANSCIMLRGGLQVSVLDRTWTGTVKIRVYAGDNNTVLWTVMENVK